MAKAKYGKWIGGALGWAFGGPLGALFGFAVGSMFDNLETAPVRNTYEDPHYRTKYRHHTTRDDFVLSLLALSGAIMQADKHHKRSELDYIKSFFVRQFGQSKTREAMVMLRDLLKREIPVREISEQIRYNMEYPLRLQLLHYLFGIARADGHVDLSEVTLIDRISGYLGISRKDFESVKAMFYKDVGHAYKVLEIDENAGDDEVKKAYRRMANKYHPDKVAHLGEEFKKAANEKFIRVKEAYETIKKERGMK